jgi:hypothetical protein
MTTDGPGIRVPVAEVRALGAALGAQAGEADGVAAVLAGAPSPGPALRAAAEDLLGCQRAAAGALAGELRWLGATITAVAASWERLDTGLLGPVSSGRAVPR